MQNIPTCCLIINFNFLLQLNTKLIEAVNIQGTENVIQGTRQYYNTCIHVSFLIVSHKYGSKKLSLVDILKYSLVTDTGTQLSHQNGAYAQ